MSETKWKYHCDGCENDSCETPRGFDEMESEIDRLKAERGDYDAKDALSAMKAQFDAAVTEIARLKAEIARKDEEFRLLLGNGCYCDPGDHLCHKVISERALSPDSGQWLRNKQAEVWDEAAGLVPSAYNWLQEDFRAKARALREGK